MLEVHYEPCVKQTNTTPKKLIQLITKNSSRLTDEIPNSLMWAYWLSPIPYAFSSLAVNEMLAPRWMDKLVRKLYHSYICLIYFNQQASKVMVTII